MVDNRQIMENPDTRKPLSGHPYLLCRPLYLPPYDDRPSVTTASWLPLREEMLWDAWLP